MKKNFVISKLMICLLSFIFSLCVVSILFQIFICFNEYTYFTYKNQKYYLDGNIDISGTIFLDENGEFNSHQNCTEVIVKINGWVPRKMLLYNFQEDIFIFDTEKLTWGIKNGEDSYPTQNPENISAVTVDYWGDFQDNNLNTFEVQKLIDITNNLKNPTTEITDWENAPSNPKNGTLNISYKKFPNNVTYSAFYFSVTEKGVFLMSLTDSFGLKYGSYITVKTENTMNG